MQLMLRLDCAVSVEGMSSMALDSITFFFFFFLAQNYRTMESIQTVPS